MRFTIPLAEASLNIEARGIVVRRAENQASMGIRFTALKKSHLEAITALVRKQSEWMVGRVAADRHSAGEPPADA
jgi:hypothetical protein